MPVREIGKSYSSLTGVIQSAKTGNQVKFESSLERDMAYLLEFDPTVLSYEIQPLKIEYMGADGSKRKYTPDFLVYYNPERELSKKLKPRLCEVKYRDDLKSKWKELKPKFKAAQAYAKRCGWEFKIYTEKEIRNDFLYNAKFLSGYLRADYNESHSSALKQAMKKIETSTPEELISICSNDKFERAQLLHALWSLVAQGFVKIDLQEKIQMDSVIWIN